MGGGGRSGTSNQRCDLVNVMDDYERNRVFAEAFAHIERSDAERESVMADIAWREANVPYENGGRPPNSKTVRARRIDTPEQPEPTVTEMSPEILARWNAWFDDRFNRAVQKQLADFAEIVGSEFAELERQLLTKFNAEIKRLDERIAELQTELRVANAKNITPMRSHVVA